MAQTVPVVTKDPRLGLIMDLIIQLAKSDFSARGNVTEKGDELDAIIAGLNLLGEELKSKSTLIEENGKRFNTILNVLIKTTQLDFSEQIAYSEKGDELDAISLGLNTMSEELESHIQQLQRSQEKISNALHQLTEAQHLAHIGSWEWEVASNTITWSEEMYKIYGRKEADVQLSFTTFLNFIHPADSTNVREIIEAAYKNPEPFAFVHRIIRPDGAESILDCKGEVHLDESGAIVRLTGTAQDVTETKRAEAKLQEYTRVLEHKNKETEQFAYVASHDLQEPLRTITNYIGLFEEDYKGKLDKDADMYLNFISGAASRMKVLISDLLEYTRIENDSERISMDCNKLVPDIIHDMNASIKETNATIHFKQLPALTGYHTRLRSLFQNLISNAIKFRKKDVDPVITIEAVDKGKDWLFSIRDNGIGIEKVYSERIFLLFQRLHSREEYKGTGIGLAHCKKIVELRGGKIWVESEPGIGSTFYFTLPKSPVL
ncbi:hypothetical protein BH11BAC7_BH11BAC7_33930 [soil metagenome]